MDLVNRLKFFLETHQIAISQFADTCGIPRPTLSQILSGRNKKISDELITKIHNAYPELSVLWLMFGEGEMETTTNIEISEPQNGEKAPYPIADQTDHQQDTTIDGDNSLFTYSGANRFGETEFSENLQNTDKSAPIQQNTLADDAEDSISFFVDYSEQKSGVNPDGDMTGSAENTQSTAQPTSPLPASGQPASQQTSHQAAVQTAGTQDTQMPPAQHSPTADSPASRASIPLSGGGSISLQSPEGKKITNIVVFYSDNSFQSFSPTV